ncbi:MAG: 30S ribosomal protein S5 [Lentisphaeria bacterium]
MTKPDFKEKNASDFEEAVVHINRNAKTVKGGRTFSFSALVVVGDRNGKVGYGFGKANEVSDAIRKASEAARNNVIEVPLNDRTLPHEMITKFKGGKVLVKPASAGTGLIAGGGVRAVLELLGVRDVLAKSLGSTNPVNVVKATFSALSQMRSKQEIFARRGITVK